MFIVWEVEGHPHYASMGANQRIAYISDIGAQGLKPLFIAGCCVTTVFLDLSFLSERWLRHTGRLAKNLGIAEKVLSGLSIVFAVAGTAGLILLSIFDTLHHPRLHDGFLLIFMGGYVISAIFICAEYQRLGIHFRQFRVLRFGFWVKLLFILVEICLAAIFVGCSFNDKQNVAAVFEWLIALVFTFYVLTFFIDLLPAFGDHQHVASEQQNMAEYAQTYGDGNGHDARHDGIIGGYDNRTGAYSGSGLDYGSDTGTYTTAGTAGAGYSNGTVDGYRGVDGNADTYNGAPVKDGPLRRDF